jgi:hypothetical protein
MVEQPAAPRAAAVMTAPASERESNWDKLAMRFSWNVKESVA